MVFTAFSFQLLLGQAISKNSADSLYRSLKGKQPDTNKINDILTLADYHFFMAENYKKGLDSALDFTRQAASLSVKLHSLEFQNRIRTYFARYDFLAGNFNEGKNKLISLIQYYHQKGDIYREASTWSELGDNVSYNDLLHVEVRLSAYQHAYNLFRKGHYQLEEIGAYKNVADVHFNQGKLELAERELLQVLARYQKIRYKKIHYTYDLLASLYSVKDDQKKELKYRLLMIQSMGTMGSIQERSSLILRAIGLYQILGRLDKCVYWLSTALALYKNIEHDNVYYATVCSGANAYIKSGYYRQAFALLSTAYQEKKKSTFATQYLNASLGSYYLALKQDGKAEYYYLKIFDFYNELAKQGNIQQYYRNACVHLANISLRQKKFDRARKYLQIATKLPPVKNQIYNSQLELAIFKVDSATGHFESAIRHFQKHKSIGDSLLSADRNRQIAELDIQYETKQKVQAIRVLNSEALSQKNILYRVNLQKNLILAALLLLCLLAFVAYRFYLYKQKNNEAILKSHKMIETKNSQLELLVEEKEWLIKEVHHRVKNNLHTIICLLESQAAHLKNDALKAIEKSQNRIFTMSLIHQKLYQTGGLQTIDMGGYIPELVQYLRDSFGIPSERINIQLDIDSISLAPSIAIPIGLIINEALTNSIKYAFPDSRQGKILISLKNQGQLVNLELNDDGIGMLKDRKDIDPVSLGLQLINGLAKEIQGDLHIETDRGFKIRIIFNKRTFNFDDLTEPRPAGVSLNLTTMTG